MLPKVSKDVISTTNKKKKRQYNMRVFQVEMEASHF